MLLINGAALFAALVIIITIVFPAISSIRQANTEVYNIRVYLEKKHERSAKAKDAIIQLEQIRESVIGLDKYIFKAGEELELITVLEDLSNKHDVTQKITSSNLDKITNQKIVMGMNLTGTYHDVFAYLRSLEQAPYFFTINRMVMSSFTDRNKPSSEPMVSLDLEFSLYVAN